MPIIKLGAVVTKHIPRQCAAAVELARPVKFQKVKVNHTNSDGVRRKTFLKKQSE